jgi:hypothetical protein
MEVKNGKLLETPEASQAFPQQKVKGVLQASPKNEHVVEVA